MPRDDARNVRGAEGCDVIRMFTVVVYSVIQKRMEEEQKRSARLQSCLRVVQSYTRWRIAIVVQCGVVGFLP